MLLEKRFSIGQVSGESCICDPRGVVGQYKSAAHGAVRLEIDIQMSLYKDDAESHGQDWTTQREWV